MVDRLLAVKRGHLVTATVEYAALNSHTLRGRRVAQLNVDIARVQQNIVQVMEIRQRLADVPSLPQRGTLL